MYPEGCPTEFIDCNCSKMTKKRTASNEETQPTTRSVGDPADIASKGPCTVDGMFEVTRHPNGEAFLSPDCFPSYVENDIWAILQEAGFTYSSGFRHKALPIKGIEHEDDLRKRLALIGLPPDLEETLEDEEDPVKLKIWVAFANVPLMEREAPKALKTTPLPSDYQALVWLGKLGFKVDGNTRKIYRNGKGGKVEEFSSVKQIRAFVRSASLEDLMGGGGAGNTGFSPRKRARRTSRVQDMPLSNDFMVALRLWGAVAPVPSQVYGQEIIISDDEEEDESMEIDEEKEDETEETINEEVQNSKVEKISEQSPEESSKVAFGKLVENPEPVEDSVARKVQEDDEKGAKPLVRASRVAKRAKEEPAPVKDKPATPKAAGDHKPEPGKMELKVEEAKETTALESPPAQANSDPEPIAEEEEEQIVVEETETTVEEQIPTEPQMASSETTDAAPPEEEAANESADEEPSPTKLKVEEDTADVEMMVDEPAVPMVAAEAQQPPPPAANQAFESYPQKAAPTMENRNLHKANEQSQYRQQVQAPPQEQASNNCIIL